MKVQHRSTSFLREAAFGFFLSLAAAVLAATLGLVLPAPIVVRALVAAVGLALALRAMAQSRERTGRIVLLALWFAAAAGAWLSGVALSAYIAIHLLLAWVVRALFACARPLEAGLELGLILLAASSAVAAAARTGSIFLACWSFLLVIALGVAIPAIAARWTCGRQRAQSDTDPNGDFVRAARAADEALQRLVNRHTA
jgi:hypothetical protein